MSTALGPSHFEIWMQFADDPETRIPLLHIQLGFQLNAIPIAGCALAVGRQVPAGIPSPVHRLLDALHISRRAQLYFRPRGAYQLGVPWPPGEQIIFDGYITAVNPKVSVSEGSQEASLHVWLTDVRADLTFSSSISGSLYPHSAVDYGFSAFFGMPFVTETTATPTILAATALERDLHGPAAVHDLWTDVLKPLLLKLALNDEIVPRPELLTCLGLGLEDLHVNRPHIIEALRHLEGETRIARLPGDGARARALERANSPYSVWNPGLVFRANIDAIKSAIRQLVLDLPVKEIVRMPIWELLTEKFASALDFAVIPRLDGFIVAPLAIGSDAVYAKAILARDYNMITVTRPVEKLLRAVVLLTKMGMIADRLPQDTQNLLGALGSFYCYAPRTKLNEKGLILILPPPEWAQTLSLSLLSGPAPNMATSVRPQDRAEPAEGVPAIQDELQSVIRSYAQHVYLREALRNRTLNVVCPHVRFDIAPGSNVYIEGTADKMQHDTEGRGRLTTDFIGIVTQVNIALNSVSQSTGTGFTIMFVRNANAHIDGLEPLEQPPLYQQYFVGAPIIDRYVFLD